MVPQLETPHFRLQKSVRSIRGSFTAPEGVAYIERVRVDNEVSACRDEIAADDAIGGGRLGYGERGEGLEAGRLRDAGGEKGGAALEISVDVFRRQGSDFVAKALLMGGVGGEEDGVPGYATNSDVKICKETFVDGLTELILGDFIVADSIVHG